MTVLRPTLLRGFLAAAAGGLLLFAACKPDKDVEGEGPYITTPYTLTAPLQFPAFPTVADNPLTEEGVALGRLLFYEKKLSSDGTVSCGTCHQQAKAFTDGRARALGVGGAQHQRSSMSLANLVWSTDLAWDGATSKLETQARVPLENPIEMHQTVAASVQKLQQTSKYPQLFRKAFGSSTITEDNLLKALAQFERTLLSTNSRYDRWTKNPSLFTADEEAGRKLFFTHATFGLNGPIRGAECFHCHNAPTFAGARGQFMNNGLDMTFADPGRGGVTKKAADMGLFVSPTLRNIALTAPYMHDGRFQTLEEVLDHYSDHVQLKSPGLDVNLQSSTNNMLTNRMNLTPTEKQQIIAFLHTLTDSSFVNNPKFSDPN